MIAHMKFSSIACLLILAVFSSVALAQKTLLIYDPGWPATDDIPALSESDEAEFNRVALPKLAAKFRSDACSVDPELKGEVTGSFTRKGAEQRLAFYQVCITGNGFGVVAVVLFDNDKVVGIWGENSGWAMDIRVVDDVDQNGINEFTLSFSGGMHQGMGGVGIELMQFNGKKPTSLGWFKAEELTDGETDIAWRVTARQMAKPIFYRQKVIRNGSGDLVRSGSDARFLLGKGQTKFQSLM